MIRELKMLHPSYSQQELCRSLGVSRQAHHKSSVRTARVVMGREVVVPLINEIRKTQRKVGGRKLYKMLSVTFKNLDVPMGRDQFFELLREEGLLLRRRKRRVRTTMSRHRMPVYPDLLKRARIERPGQAMASDITYWAVPEGFYYVFLITDVCSIRSSVITWRKAWMGRTLSKPCAWPLVGVAMHSKARSTTVTEAANTATPST